MRCFYLSALVSAVFHGLPSLHGAERDELVEVLNALRQNLTAIRTHEFTFQESSSDGIQKGSHHIIQAGALKRANLFVGKADQAEMIFAYDGKRFQNFSKEMSTLSFSKSNRFPTAYGTIHPILLLYCWLADFSSSFEDLQAPKTWANLQDRIQWRSIVSHDDGKFQFDVLDSQDAQRSYVVHLHRIDLPLPEKIEALDASKQLIFSITMKDHITVDSPNQKVWFPTSIVSEDGGVHREIAISASSVQINHSVSPTRFTLSQDMARTVDDFDGNTERLIKSAALQQVESSNDAAQTHSYFGYLYYILISFCLVIAIAALLRIRGTI